MPGNKGNLGTDGAGAEVAQMPTPDRQAPAPAMRRGVEGGVSQPGSQADLPGPGKHTLVQRLDANGSAPVQSHTGPQVQRAPSKLIELHGQDAENKLIELGGKLVTDPDYSDGHKAIQGSNVQYTVLSPRSQTIRLGVHQWTHDGPGGFHMQSITAVGRPDSLPSAAGGANGLFVNAHNAGATTIPLSKAGAYRTQAWVRAGVDERGVFVGYNLYIDHVIEVTHLERAVHEAGRKLPANAESFDKFHDTMSVQTALLRPGGPDMQSRERRFSIETRALNPSRISEGALVFSASDGREDGAEPLTYHWYISPQTKDRPPITFGGKTITGVGGRRGYAFGTGATIAMPAEHAGFWVVWYQAKDAAGSEIGEASYLQTILSGSDMKSLEKHVDYMDRIDRLGEKIEGEKLPVRAVHISAANGNATQLRMFIGRAASGFVLIDATPGIDAKSNRLEYTSSTGAGVLDEFFRLNKYPEGRLRLNVEPNRFGIDTHMYEKETTGQGQLDRLSSNLSVGGMIALGVGILAAPVTRGQSLQVAMVIAGGLNAAAGAVSLYERLQHAETSATGVALDIVNIASSLLNAGVAVRGIAAGPGIVLANRATKFVLWANFIADGASALLISAEGMLHIAGIIDNEQLRPEQKREAVIRVVTNLIMASALLAVSYGQTRELRGKLASVLGNALAAKLGDETCTALSMLDDQTLHSLKGAAEPGLIKLGSAIRSEPAIVTLVQAEHRLPKILELMRDGNADDLRFAILRANAHEVGAPSANTARLVEVTRAAGITADTVANWGGRAFARLSADADTLAALEGILPLVRNGRITNLSSWLEFGGKKVGDDAKRTAGELREAVRQATVHPRAQVDIGSDLHAPRNPVNPSESLQSFDMEIKQDGRAMRSIEVGTAGGPDGLVRRGSEIGSGVSHAIDKLVSRNAAGVPVPGKHEATVRIALASVWDQKSGGVIEISPNGDRMRVTRQNPPTRQSMPNVFDEFTSKIAHNPMHGLLDRINVVDASSGELLAQYENVGGIWKRVR